MAVQAGAKTHPGSDLSRDQMEKKVWHTPGWMSMPVLLTSLPVYIGDTASLSFLDFLRRHLRPYVGATPFTDGERHNPMLETDVAHVMSVEINLDLGEEEALFQSYSEAVRCLYFSSHLL